MMNVELTAQEAQKVRECLTQIQVSGPTDALREHVRLVDAVLAKLRPSAGEGRKGFDAGNADTGV